MIMMVNIITMYKYTDTTKCTKNTQNFLFN